MATKKVQWTLLSIISMSGITWFLYNYRIDKSLKRRAYANIYSKFDTNASFTELGSSSASFDGPPLFFVITTDNRRPLTLRAACAVESAAKHHTHSLVKLLPASAIQDDNTMKVLRGLPNVEIVNVTIAKVLSGTPLQEWYATTSNKGGKYEITHLSDALRITLIWKYGGIYMDTDVWSLKSLAGLRNTIGMECSDTVNGAVMHFDKHHPFVYDVIAEFVLVYDKDAFTVVGPALLTKVLKRKCNVTGKVDSVPLKTYASCYNVTVLPTVNFYPLDFVTWPEYFKISDQTFPNSYTFHLWNQITHDTTTKVGSEVLLEKTAQRVCPNVYKLMQINGTI